jgi:thiamine biosynthesis lipoprotein
MGTGVKIWLWHNHDQRAATALAAAERTFALLEARLSRFRPQSELSRLNRAAGTPFTASPVLYELVTAALAWHERTGGIFDPTVLSSLLAYGYDRTFAEVQAEQAANLPPAQRNDLPSSAGKPALGNARAVRLGPGRQILLPAGVGLDLGGIAKGWAAQQVANRLGMVGPCLVDAGGDIACAGAPPTGPWLVTVTDPRNEALDCAVLTLNDAAVATSSRTRRQWQHAGQPAHHLIDPRTGAPAATELLSVTVAAPRLPDAEVYAKCALILGAGAGLAYLQHQSHIRALLITDDGRQLTCGLREDQANGSIYLSSHSFVARFRAPAGSAGNPS